MDRADFLSVIGRHSFLVDNGTVTAFIQATTRDVPEEYIPKEELDEHMKGMQEAFQAVYDELKEEQ